MAFWLSKCTKSHSFSFFWYSLNHCVPVYHVLELLLILLVASSTIGFYVVCVGHHPVHTLFAAVHEIGQTLRVERFSSERQQRPEVREWRQRILALRFITYLQKETLKNPQKEIQCPYPYWYKSGILFPKVVISILNLGFTAYSVTFGWTSFGLTQAEGMDELNCFLWSPPDEDVCTSIWSDQVPTSKHFVTILITPFYLNSVHLLRGNY